MRIISAVCLALLLPGAAWAQGVAGVIWQRSFWDHFLRAEEQLEEVVSYGLNNPVRRGLVEDWQDYPFAGSLALDLRGARREGTSPSPTARVDPRTAATISQPKKDHFE